jgi:hypothetical protein
MVLLAQIASCDLRGLKLHCRRLRAPGWAPPAKSVVFAGCAVPGCKLLRTGRIVKDNNESKED